MKSRRWIELLPVLICEDYNSRPEDNDDRLRTMLTKVWWSLIHREVAGTLAVALGRALISNPQI
jgi:hypothetical protein